MKYKILMFDGRPVEQVFTNHVTYCDPDRPRLYPYSTTIDELLLELEDWETARKAMLRKCDLEEVELRFLKDI